GARGQRGRRRDRGVLWRPRRGAARDAAGESALRHRDGAAPMARDERLICDSAALAEGAKGVRFELRESPGEEKGFAVRHRGKACAYVNRCPHLGTELDWQPGEFFE